MNLGAIGTAISLLTTFLFAVGGLITIRSRRLSNEAKELRELREYNVASTGYIYDLEMALMEITKKTGVALKIDKPEILKRSYLEARAQESGNQELQQMAQLLTDLRDRTPDLQTGKGTNE